MGTETASTILDPIIQYGFAGFCALLLGFLYWLIRRLLDLFERVTKVIGENSELVRTIDVHLMETREILFSMRDKFLTLKCVGKDSR
jgi:hypothetical protein